MKKLLMLSLILICFNNLFAKDFLVNNLLPKGVKLLYNSINFKTFKIIENNLFALSHSGNIYRFDYPSGKITGEVIDAEPFTCIGDTLGDDLLVGKTDGSVCKLSMSSLNLDCFDKIANPPLFIFNVAGKSGREIIAASFNKLIYHPDQVFYVSYYQKTHYTNGETIFDNLTLKCSDSIKMYGAERFWPVDDCCLSEKYDKIYFKIKSYETVFGTGSYDYTSNKINKINRIIDSKFYKDKYGDIYGSSEYGFNMDYSFYFDKLVDDTVNNVYSSPHADRELKFTKDSMEIWPNLFSKEIKEQYKEIYNKVGNQIKQSVYDYIRSLQKIGIDYYERQSNALYDSIYKNIDTINSFNIIGFDNIYNYKGGYLVESRVPFGKELCFYKDSAYTALKIFNLVLRRSKIVEKNNEIYFYNTPQNESNSNEIVKTKRFKLYNLDSLIETAPLSNDFDMDLKFFKIKDYLFQMHSYHLVVFEPQDRIGRYGIEAIDTTDGYDYPYTAVIFPNRFPCIFAGNSYFPFDMSYKSSKQTIKISENIGSLKPEIFYIKYGADTLTIYSGVGWGDSSILFSNMGVFFYNVQNDSLSKSMINIKDSTIIYTCIDKRGAVWAAGEYLYKISNPETGEFEKILNLKNIPISQLIPDEVTGGVLLVATDRGVYIVDR